jgi:WD40 repeat protein
LALKGEFEQGQSLSVSPDGKRMVTVGFPTHMHMRVLDLEKGTTVGDEIAGVTMPIAFLPDGKHVVAAQGGNPDGPKSTPGIRVWDIEKRKRVLTLRGLTSGKLAVSADGSFVAVGASDGTISVWQMPKLSR